MLTDVEIINNGLSKISTNRITRLNPATTPLEKYMAANYPQWRNSELAKRRWVFATEDDYPLTLEATLVNVDKPYKFGLPIDCLRPIRTRRTEWKQRGRFLYSAGSTLSIDYIRRADESEFDPLFNDVLASRVAFESAEYVTQSNTKKESARLDYKEALDIAAAANAFVIGAEDISGDDTDDDYSWLRGRHG